METLWRGRTLGKAAMGLRVVRDDGGPIRFRHAFVRGLVGVVLDKPGITYGLGALIPMHRDEHGKKRLGDMAAGTIVLQERVPAQLDAPVAMPPPLAGWAAGLDLAGGRRRPRAADAAASSAAPRSSPRRPGQPWNSSSPPRSLPGSGPAPAGCARLGDPHGRSRRASPPRLRGQQPAGSPAVAVTRRSAALHAPARAATSINREPRRSAPPPPPHRLRSPG